MDFTRRRARNLLRQTCLNDGTARCLPPGGHISEIMEMLIHNGTLRTPMTSDICRTLLQLLVQKIAQTYFPDAAKPGGAFETYLHGRATLDQNFRRLHSLDELAKLSQLDPAYLCRLFKEFDTCSPYQALIQLKMDHAATALVRSGHQLKHVALEVGYEDTYQFSRVFKRVHGVSPKAFIRRS